MLSVYQCASWDEALAIENANPFGNAAAIYTTNGGSAEYFTSRFRAVSFVNCMIVNSFFVGPFICRSLFLFFVLSCVSFRPCWA